MTESFNQVFVDTSAWIAFLDAGDSAHDQVVRFLKAAVGKSRLFTTDYVVFETLTYLNCSLKNHQLAATFYESCKDTSGLEIVRVPPESAQAALAEFFFKFKDQSISVVDAVSFYIMKQLGLEFALAIDNHFKIAGFQTIALD